MDNRFFDCITDFIFLENEPERADVIFVPGGNYPDSAKRAAALFHAGYAPYVLPSGRYSKLKGYFEEPGTKDPGMQDSGENARKQEKAYKRENACKQENVRNRKHETEWEYLRDILLEEGVPEEAILKEDRATFTWENAIYSKAVLETMQIDIKTAIIVCQAFHARRCSMYYQEQFPGTRLLICPVVTKEITRENWFLAEEKIDVVLGEMERCGSQFHDIMKARLHDESRAVL